MSKILYVVFFLVGFVAASHWDGGRNLVREVSPFAPKTFTQKVKSAVGQDMGSKVKKAFKDGKDAIQEGAKKLQ